MPLTLSGVKEPDRGDKAWINSCLTPFLPILLIFPLIFGPL
jgi:hypothetical protein